MDRVLYGQAYCAPGLLLRTLFTLEGIQLMDSSPEEQHRSANDFYRYICRGNRYVPQSQGREVVTKRETRLNSATNDIYKVNIESEIAVRSENVNDFEGIGTRYIWILARVCAIQKDGLDYYDLVDKKFIYFTTYENARRLSPDYSNFYEGMYFFTTVISMLTYSYEHRFHDYCYRSKCLGGVSW
jgi:hypothetical protein